MNLRAVAGQPWAVALMAAVPLAVAYLILAPPATDLAAATYRSDLFARVGFTTWDTGWYAAHGHWLPAYSLLSPALGALLGVRLLLALSAIGASVLFALIAERAFSATAARIAGAWFVFGFCVGLLSGRVPFDLGFAIGLGSILALMRGAGRSALVLTALTSVASPVAGAFLALVWLAYAVADTRRGLAFAATALAPILVLSIAFPEGGYEPFVASAFWPALIGVALIALLLPQGPMTSRGWDVVRAAAALYALALIGAFAIHTPVGGNAARLGPLLAAPLLAGVLWDRRRGTLLLLAPILLYWQIVTPLRDLSSVAGDRSTHSSYYAPLLSELHRLRHGEATIVEVPLTKAHWESAYLAGHTGVSLARGWERQLDTRYAALFYRAKLSASAYRMWLLQNKVAYVALPDAPLDRAGRLEDALIEAGTGERAGTGNRPASGTKAGRQLPYLRELWHSQHWHLYRFMG